MSERARCFALSSSSSSSSSSSNTSRSSDWPLLLHLPRRRCKITGGPQKHLASPLSSVLLASIFIRAERRRRDMQTPRLLRRTFRPKRATANVFRVGASSAEDGRREAASATPRLHCPRFPVKLVFGVSKPESLRRFHSSHLFPLLFSFSSFRPNAAATVFVSEVLLRRKRRRRPRLPRETTTRADLKRVFGLEEIGRSRTFPPARHSRGPHRRRRRSFEARTSHHQSSAAATLYTEEEEEEERGEIDRRALHTAATTTVAKKSCISCE